jgi:hypothetical protein
MRTINKCFFRIILFLVLLIISKANCTGQKSERNLRGIINNCFDLFIESSCQSYNFSKIKYDSSLVKSVFLVKIVKYDIDWEDFIISMVGISNKNNIDQIENYGCYDEFDYFLIINLEGVPETSHSDFHFDLINEYNNDSVFLLEKFKEYPIVFMPGIGIYRIKFSRRYSENYIIKYSYKYPLKNVPKEYWPLPKYIDTKYYTVDSTGIMFNKNPLINCHKDHGLNDEEIKKALSGKVKVKLQ